MKAITSIKELYIEFLADIYNAEVLIVPELRLFMEKVTSEPFKQTLKAHLANTRSHMTHLEELQENLAADILDEHCRTMKSMILETKELVDRCTDNELTERAISASLRRITQCQITVYQMLVAMADELALPSHKKILEQCLNEETDFDFKLQPSAFMRTSG